MATPRLRHQQVGRGVVLRDAHDQFGLPVAVFRCDMMLPDTRYAGQVNPPDVFARTLLSLVLTGIAPGSFYESTPTAVARRRTTTGCQSTSSRRRSPRWRRGGQRVSDVPRGEPRGRRHRARRTSTGSTRRATRSSASPTTTSGSAGLRPRCAPSRDASASIRCCHCCTTTSGPSKPLRGALASTERFHAAVQEAKVGPDKDIPHVTAELIIKYITDLQLLGLL